MQNKHTEISKFFNNFIESFYRTEPTNFDLENLEILRSRAIASRGKTFPPLLVFFTNKSRFLC